MQSAAPIVLKDAQKAEEFALGGLNLVAHPHGASAGCVAWEVTLGQGPWAVAVATVEATYELSVDKLVASCVGGGERSPEVHRHDDASSGTPDSATDGAAATPARAWPSSGQMPRVAEGSASVVRRLVIEIDRTDEPEASVSIRGTVDGEEVSIGAGGRVVVDDWRWHTALYLLLSGEVLEVKRLATCARLGSTVDPPPEPVSCQHLCDGSSVASFPVTVEQARVAKWRLEDVVESPADMGAAGLVFAEPRVDADAIAVLDGNDPYVVHGLVVDEYDTQWLKVEIGEEMARFSKDSAAAAPDAGAPSVDSTVIQVGAGKPGAALSVDTAAQEGEETKEQVTAQQLPLDGRTFGWVAAQTMALRTFMDPLPRHTVAAFVASTQAGHKPAPLAQQRHQAWRLLTASVQDSALSPMSLRLFGIALDAKLRAGLISAAVTIASLVANQIAKQL